MALSLFFFKREMCFLTEKHIYESFWTQQMAWTFLEVPPRLGFRSFFYFLVLRGNPFLSLFRSIALLVNGVQSTKGGQHDHRFQGLRRLFHDSLRRKAALQHPPSKHFCSLSRPKQSGLDRRNRRRRIQRHVEFPLIFLDYQ